MQRRISIFMFRAVFLFLATYGILYFSYKYYLPHMGGNDFEAYYNMYVHLLDMDQAGAPHIYRQTGAVITHLIYRAGIYYPNEIAFSDPSKSQRIFFAALFSNYLALYLTALVVTLTVDRLTGKSSLMAPLLAGLLCFLSFFTQQSVITGLNEGWSWFLVAAIFYGYVGRKLRIVAPLLLLSIFQRETIPIVFGVIAAMSILTARKKPERIRFSLAVLSVSGVAFIAYVVMRLFVIPVEGFEYQLEPGGWISRLLGREWQTKEFILQSILSQNIFFLFMAGRLYTLSRNPFKEEDCEFGKWNLLQMTILLFVMTVIGLAAGNVNDVGRVTSNLTPIMASLTGQLLYSIGNYSRSD